MPLLAAVLLSFVALGGCGGDLPESPDYEVDPKNESEVVRGEDDDGSSGGGEGVKGEDDLPPEPATSTPEPGPAPSADRPAPAPAPVVETTYKGTLATTPELQFGPPEGCQYTVQMKDVAVTLGVEAGTITTATVSSTMVEKIVGSCGTPGIKPNPHDFALAQTGLKIASADRATIDVPMKATHATQPRTSLKMDIVKKDAGYRVTLWWQREDNLPEAYRWVVKTDLTLQI